MNNYNHSSREPSVPLRRMVVSSLAAIAFVVGGVGTVAVSLLIGPIMTEFTWSNGFTSSAAGAFNLAALLVAPGVGVALDKFGARPVMAAGVLAVSTGFLLASHCRTRLEMLVAFVLAGVGYSGSVYVPTAVVVTNWMQSKESMGMGIVLGSTSVGAALFSVLISGWIENYGWRFTSVMLAMLVVMMLPLIVLAIRTRPPRAPKTGDLRSEKDNSSRVERNLLLSKDVIVATTSSALFATGMFAVYYHVVPVLVKAQYSIHVAGLVLGASLVLSALGSLVLGVVAERVGPKPILAGALLASAIGTLFLLGVGDKRTGEVCVLTFVILWGASTNSVIQFIPVIFAERFGSQSLGTLVGTQSSIMGIAGAASPVVTGLLYDRFGDYRIAIYLSASAIFLSFVAALLIKVPAAVTSDGSSIIAT